MNRPTYFANSIDFLLLVEFLLTSLQYPSMLWSFSMTKWRERSKHQIPEGKVKQIKVTTKVEILATLIMTLEASLPFLDLFAQTSGKVQPVLRCSLMS